MDRWEYLTVELWGKEEKRKATWDAEYFTEQQNYYGQQGWELVSIFITPISDSAGNSCMHGVFATFKRKVQ